MKLPAAIARIKKSFAKMDQLYGRAVFDEIAIVGLEGRSLDLLHYAGPRKGSFMSEFPDDSLALRKELLADQTGLGGEFNFTREGDGEATDAYICLGPDLYLFCNHTGKSMTEITEDPNWFEAQAAFVELTQFFAADPLDLDD